MLPSDPRNMSLIYLPPDVTFYFGERIFCNYQSYIVIVRSTRATSQASQGGPGSEGEKCVYARP